jgi:hypothetical protein
MNDSDTWQGQVEVDLGNLKYNFRKYRKFWLETKNLDQEYKHNIPYPRVFSCNHNYTAIRNIRIIKPTTLVR